MTLPKTPSKLIRLAIKDFRRVLKMKSVYKVDMNDWHKPNSHCSVCLAGAVIAGTLGRKPDEYMLPADFNDDTCNALNALDAFRGGLVVDGVNWTKSHLSDKQREALYEIEGRIGDKIWAAMHAKDWRTFNRHMLKLADELEAIKL